MRNVETHSVASFIPFAVLVFRCLKEWLEEIFEIFRRNSNAIVSHFDFDFNFIRLFWGYRLLGDVYLNDVLWLRKFDRVRNKVENYLLQAQLV